MVSKLVRTQFGLSFIWLIGCIVGIRGEPQSEPFTDCRTHKANELTCECPDRDDLARVAKEPNITGLTTADANADTAFAEVAGLSTLRKLNANNVGQAHIIGIGQLTQLEELFIVVDRAELHPNLIPLENLRNLRVLRVGCRGTVDLTPLSRLASLRTLEVGSDCKASGLEQFRAEVALDIPNERPAPAEDPAQPLQSICAIDPDACPIDYCANRTKQVTTFVVD